MILKKPYAFLIKHFKLIHLILAVLMSYILYKSYIIADFYEQSVQNNYVAILTGNIAGQYVNYFMYLGVILILGILIAIYYLLSHKDKPRKFYVYAIIYYIIVFAFLSLNYNFILTMMEKTIEPSTLRVYRDISSISMLPQIAFIVYSIISFIGFNIKKFDFEKDIKELEIEEADSEEFEITFGKNTYKRKRDIRRFLREFKYYILENKFTFTIILIVSGIIIVTSVFLNKEVYNKEYRIDDTIAHNSFSVAVLDSIISPYSYNGQIIKNNKYYVAVKINVKNISSTTRVLDYSNFRLIVEGKHLKPILEKSSYFMDFAEPYYGEVLKKNTSKTICLVYEINKNQIAEEYEYKIFRGSKTEPGEIISQYSELMINPVLLEEKADANIVDLKELLKFNYSNIGNSSIKISDYLLTKNYQFSFEKCQSEDKCITLNDAVAIDYTIIGDYNILVAFDYELNLDKESLYYKSSSNIKDFVNNYMTLEYEIGQEKYIANAIYRENNNLKGTFVIQTTDKISSADKLSAVFTIRNKKYIVKLK